MKSKNTVSIIVIIVAALSLIAAICGILPGNGAGYNFISLHGQTVSVYGIGLYKNDSSSIAAQAIGQDIITVIFGVPLLLFSLYHARHNFIKGKLLLTGTLGYFLYTYTSYTFLSMYNSFFLIYVMLMSLSFYAFTIMMLSFDLKSLQEHFSEKLPVKLIGGLLIFIAGLLGLMWLKMIVTPLMNGSVPSELEHYTTLSIQALDLGFVIPAAVISGILLIRRQPLGYLLSAVIIIKETALLAAITAMIIMQAISGVQVSAAVIILFCMFDIVIIICLSALIKNVKEKN